MNQLLKDIREHLVIGNCSEKAKKMLWEIIDALERKSSCGEDGMISCDELASHLRQLLENFSY